MAKKNTPVAKKKTPSRKKTKAAKKKTTRIAGSGARKITRPKKPTPRKAQTTKAKRAASKKPAAKKAKAKTGGKHKVLDETFKDTQQHQHGETVLMN